MAFAGVRDCPSHPAMSSQYGQDQFALRILGGLREGFFLDSGASDGVSCSNTLLLERAYGWRGVCVEPNLSFFAELERNRRCICVNCCLYDRDTTVDFIEAHTISGIVDEYDPSLLKQVNAMFGMAEGGPPPTVKRTARSVRSILQASSAPRIIDYWSLDTEGSEIRILKSFPIEEYAFRVLTVEHNWLPVRDQIRRFLEAHGYRRVAELGCDDGYVLEAQVSQEGLISLPSWRSRAWSRRKPIA
ncbi:FkbM family methyltransferase [Mesorhizobium sp. M0408]|uniref:FkbM family methyltransferase n=1 Tax=Mesorhizobium sp. M0408 TaxID=2956942 RepID=UPI00333A3D23